MAEYIDREAYTCRDCFHWVACKKMLEAAGYIVGENYKPYANRCDTFTLAADVVEVVRCRDCKHWHESTGYCEKHSYFIGADGMSCSPAESPTWTPWDEDDFCSDGQRKEG